MQKYFNAVQNRHGAAVSNASIIVTTLLGVDAILYSDNGVTVRSAVLTTDANGYFEFYVADGRYNISISGPTITPITINDILLEDPADGAGAGTAFLTLASGSGFVGFSHAETYTAGTLGARSKQHVNVMDAPYNATGNGVADDTAAINAAAAYCRSSGRPLKFQPVSTYYLISGTVDLSGIKNIDGRGALLRGAFSGIPAAIIGGSGITNGDIWLDVRNTADRSIVAGTNGINILSISDSKLVLGARGFNTGLYFDGISSNAIFVGLEVRVLQLYNNGSMVHFDMDGTSYAVNNQFRGGSYYMGSGQALAGRGTFKVSLLDDSLVSELVVDCPQIGIDSSSADASHAAFVYADAGSTSSNNSIFFRNARLECYGTFSATLKAVNIGSGTSAQLAIDIDALSMPVNLDVATVALSNHRIWLEDRANRAGLSTNSKRQLYIPEPCDPYAIANAVYCPGRIVYDGSTGYNVPVASITTGVSTRLTRAIGDGLLVSGATTNSVGLIYKKGVIQPAFLKLLGRTPAQVSIVCFDASGVVLSGTAPYYVQGRQCRSVVRGSVTIYETVTNWLWIHKDVDSFYIGQACWSSNDLLSDTPFELTYGPQLTRLTVGQTAKNRIASASPTGVYLPVGASVDGTATNGWRNTFFLRTSTSAPAASADASIVVTSATGIAVGDTIGVELDTVISGVYKQFHSTTVSSVAGTTIGLTVALPAAVSSAAVVLFNRWVAR